MYKSVPDNISQTNSQIVTDTSVYSDFVIANCVVRENNANCVLPSFSLQQNCVTTKELKLIHFGLRIESQGLSFIAFSKFYHPIYIIFRNGLQDCFSFLFLIWVQCLRFI